MKKLTKKHKELISFIEHMLSIKEKKKKKEVEVLVEDLLICGETNAWVKVDWGEAEVIDMIEETLEKEGFGTKTKEEIQAIAQEYEEEAIKWAEMQELEIIRDTPVRINLGEDAF